MLLLTIDPVMKTAAVLSIPRDLWVPIPMGANSTEGHINSAHYFGELYDWPGGGPALATDTVEYLLGVPIDYYARVDFPAFERLIDLIDGVDVYVEEEICSGCGLCLPSCPYDAREMHAWRHIAEVNTALCQGCGACTMVCPNKACQVRNLTHQQILSMVEAYL